MSTQVRQSIRRSENSNQWYQSYRTLTFQTFHRNFPNLTVLTLIHECSSWMGIWEVHVFAIFPSCSFCLIFCYYGCHYFFINYSNFVIGNSWYSLFKNIENMKSTCFKCFLFCFFFVVIVALVTILFHLLFEISHNYFLVFTPWKPFQFLQFQAISKTKSSQLLGFRTPPKHIRCHTNMIQRLSLSFVTNKKDGLFFDLC